MTLHPNRAPRPVSERIPLNDLLEGCSSEVASSARSCTELQWVISRLLESANHPDLAAEMHVLQDIDRLQQTLGDLACLLELIGKKVQDQSLEKTDVAASLRLMSLRVRLLNETVATEAPEEQLESCENSDVTWL